MVALETPKALIGTKAADFSLKGTDGNMHRLADVADVNGLLVLFICNHCPYVQKQMTRIVAAAKRLQEAGIGVVAINPNDAKSYPEDSFENMQRYASEQGFCFPYLHDESQSVARAYGAVCTPDFFGYNSALELQFRGRLDTSWSGIEEDPEAELVPAMLEIAKTGATTIQQHPSIGCSIKWKRELVN